MVIFPPPYTAGYTQVTQTQALAALGERLEDPTNIYWAAAELRLYIAEAIRTWQAYTGWYRSPYSVPVQPNTIWYDIASYKVTDSQLVSVVLYHLLEAQLVNNAWAGTKQFDLALIQTVLRNRVDRYLADTGVVSTHLMQSTGTPIQQPIYSFGLVPSGRVRLQSNTIDVRRVAWESEGTNHVLWRSSEWGLNSFLPGWKKAGGTIPLTVPIETAVNGAIVPGLGTAVNGAVIEATGLRPIGVNGWVAGSPMPTPAIPVAIQVNEGTVTGTGVSVNGLAIDPTVGASIAVNGITVASPEPNVSGIQIPQVYSVAATPPVSLQLGPTPPAYMLGTLDLVVVQSGPPLSLSPSVLGVPDDLAWGIKWGVLADLLSRDGQAKDPARAVYCEQRYREAVELASLYSTVVETTINGEPVFTGSVFDMDAFSNGWQNALSGVPTAAGLIGRNLFALSPAPNSNAISVVLDMIVNIPVPVSDSDYLQVPPDIIPVILDYAQHLASFKMGGTEFAVTEQQRANLLYEAANYNSRLRQTNFYNSTIRNLTMRQQEQVPRLDMARANG